MCVYGVIWSPNVLLMCFVSEESWSRKKLVGWCSGVDCAIFTNSLMIEPGMKVFLFLVTLTTTVVCLPAWRLFEKSSLARYNFFSWINNHYSTLFHKSEQKLVLLWKGMNQTTFVSFFQSRFMSKNTTWKSSRQAGRCSKQFFTTITNTNFDYLDCFLQTLEVDLMP